MDEHLEPMSHARGGLVAWQRGDLTALVDLFDPDVELLWWTPGNWDCHGKEAVLALLTARVKQGPPAEVDILEVNDTTLLVERSATVLGGPEPGFRPATLVRLRNGRVVRMQQYRSREDALTDSHGQQ
ncbi:MAG: nuclear transport factor 2 family protein [Actinomycetota bacterium]|nr:nuclear transport factor 2 family protein [Actinomycetota bacterium]